MAHSTGYRRILNRMGYYNYQNGLIYRHLNQSGGWDSHLEHCRNFILRAVEMYSPEKITVLGSGWLLELPLSEILDRSIKVTLVDIIHPPEVLTQAGKLPQVTVFEADVTGGLIEEVWNKTRKYSFFNKLKSLDGIIIPEHQFGEDPGMVISLNVVTQLESLLVDFIRKRSKIDEGEFLKFRTAVQNKHLDFLKKYNSVLVSDYSELTTHRSGVQTSERTLFAELPAAKHQEEWSWDFDKTGSDFYNSTSLMKVVALIL